MPRGGKRQGTAGKAYGNRTDLNAPKPPATQFTGQPYGARLQQEQAQQAVPTGPTQVPPPAPMAPGPPSPAPGEAGALTRPTERPGEPVTHGLPTGPGAGPEALGPGFNAGDPITMRIRALYSQYPLQEIADLLS